MEKLIFVAIYLVLLMNTGFGNIVEPSCLQNQEQCELTLYIHEHLTMAYSGFQNDIHNDQFIPFKLQSNGSMTLLDTCGHVTETNETIIEEVKKLVPTADGSHRLVYLFNGSLPGPPVVVYKGQQVVVKVINNLKSEAVSIHWHGLQQEGTPWMDGAAPLSQCSILPGDTFTYMFTANDVGTHWYHTQSVIQRAMGAYGPFIVLEQEDEADQGTSFVRGEDPLPSFDEEFIIMVQDWFDRSAEYISLLMKLTAEKYYNGFDIEKDECYIPESTDVPYNYAGDIPWKSGLINGKGRQYDRLTDMVLTNTSMEAFTVRKGEKYRFRVINAAMDFNLQISIDNHQLNVIAIDGNDVVSTTVDYIMIGCGERYDFWIEADNPIDNYFIRVLNKERFKLNGQLVHQGHVEAILRYEGSPEILPITEMEPCSDDNHCTVLNCPSRYDPKWSKDESQEIVECLLITDLRNPLNEPVYDPENVVTHLLNFHPAFTGYGASVNGFRNVLPTWPRQMYGQDLERRVTRCNAIAEKCANSEICDCTNILEVEVGSVVQLVLSAVFPDNKDNPLKNVVHQVHFHGIKQHIIKMRFRPENGKGHNKDLTCLDAWCNKVSYNPDEQDEEDVIMKGAPLKDTISIPNGGYVVTRFKAINPGYWLVDYLNKERGGLIIKIGDDSEMPYPPINMPQCGNIDLTSNEFLSSMDSTNIRNAVAQTTFERVRVGNGTYNYLEVREDQADMFLIIIYCLVGLCAVCIIVIIVLTILLFRQQSRRGYAYVPSSDEGRTEVIS